MPVWPKTDPDLPFEDLLLQPPTAEEQLEADWNTLRGEPVEPGEVPRMAKADLKKFILGVIDNSIFTNFHIRMRRISWCPQCDANAATEKMPCHVCDSPVGIKSEPDIEWNMVFLPIAFGVLEGWSRQQLNKIGCIWAYNRDALPRGINGYPMFPTVGLLHVEDWVKAETIIRRESKRFRDLDIDE